VAEERWDLILTSQAELSWVWTIFLKEHGDDAFDEALNGLLALQEEPIPEGVQHLRNTKDYYRIYLYRSLYRAVYRVLVAKRIVLIERIGPRRSVYRGFDRW